MAQEKKGLIARMLEGKERSEEYARSTLPTNRWQLFFDIFKGNFGKIVKVNFLILLFFIPMIAIIVLFMLLGNTNNAIYPFGSNLTTGYPAQPNTAGLSEMLKLQSDGFMYGAFRPRFLYRRHRAGGRDVRHPQHGVDGRHLRRQRFLAGGKAQLLERPGGGRSSSASLRSSPNF